MAQQEAVQPESMEEILSSIRETVEEEAAAAGRPSPLVEEKDPEEVAMEAVLAEAGEEIPTDDTEENVPIAEEEALDLSAMLEEDEEEPVPVAEPAPHPKSDAEDVIDIAAFNATGEEMLADEEKAENARELYRGGEAPDPAKDAAAYAADLSEEDKTSTGIDQDFTEEKEAKEEAVFQGEEEEVTLGGSPETGEPEAKTKTAAEEVFEEEMTAQTATEEQIEEVAKVATAALTQTVAVSPNAIHLPTAPSADGLQVTFPVEVLAAALRPLVKNWVAANLPNVVERLVKEELEKLANQ